MWLTWMWENTDFHLKIVWFEWKVNSIRHLPCRRQVTGHSCHGPTHQFAGHGTWLQTRSFLFGWSFSALDQQNSSSTMPLTISMQIGSRCWIPPSHVAEQADQSPSFQWYSGSFDSFAGNVYSNRMPGFLLLPRTNTCRKCKEEIGLNFNSTVMVDTSHRVNALP